MSTKLLAPAFLSMALLAACSSVTPSDSSPTEPATPAPSSSEETTEASEDPTSDPTTDPTEEPTPEEPTKLATLSIISAGDILLHPSIYESARVGDTFDFTYQYEHIRDWIEGADLALCSLEAPIAPAGEAYTGYPMFGSPGELISSLKTVGWDGCNLATNHTMDRGFAGVERTVSLLRDQDMGFAGAAPTEEDFNQTQFYTLEVDGQQVEVAHLSATTLTNGLVAPADKPWSWYVVGELGPYEVEDIVADAERARDNGADIVVVSMHWGTEYVSEPIEEQLTIADQLAASGQVDLVFGNHSHVPEPITKVEGGPDGRGMWTVWSMGNLISGQTVANHGYRVTTGVMATANVDVYCDGHAEVAGLDWTVITQDAPGGNRLYRLTDVLESNVTTLSDGELLERGNVTYPVMNADGSAERREVPTPVATGLSQDRR